MVGWTGSSEGCFNGQSSSEAFVSDYSTALLDTKRYPRGECHCRHSGLRHLRPPLRRFRCLLALLRIRCICGGFDRVHIVCSRHVQFSATSNQPLVAHLQRQWHRLAHLFVCFRSAHISQGALVNIFGARFELVSSIGSSNCWLIGRGWMWRKRVNTFA